MSEQKVILNYCEKNMKSAYRKLMKREFKSTGHTHLNLLDGNKLLKGGLIK
jgi:hypothetical protein